MRIVIAGGHGQIALLLSRRLTDRGDSVVGLIRNPAHAAEVIAAGAEPVICDLEAVDAVTLAGHLAGADAVVFAAGAGPGSGIPRKDSVDRAAAALLADAAERGRDPPLPAGLGHGDRRAAAGRRGLLGLHAGQGGRRARICAAATWTGRSCAPAASRTTPPPAGYAWSRTSSPARSPATTWPRYWSPSWTSPVRPGRRWSSSAAGPRWPRPYAGPDPPYAAARGSSS